MSLLNKPWYQRFRKEMEAIGCVFPKTSAMFDEDIKVPIDKLKEATKIINRYKVRR